MRRSQEAAGAAASLLAVKKEFPDCCSTLDAATVATFEEIFAQVQGPGKAILEVGSGHGFTCVFFAMLGARELHGVDVMPSAIQVAEEVKRRVDPSLPVIFRLADATRGLPYDDAAFDVVLLIETLSHVVMADLEAFLREMVRVLRAGGLLYLSDGNNARSWRQRRQNYRIWERFDQGPPTRGEEKVYSHRIGTPYAALRREMALKAVPSLSETEAERIAARTFRLTEAEVGEAARRYAVSGEWPNSPFRPRVCPIDPVHGMYIEQLIDPLEVRRHLNAAGCDEVYCGPRRRLPLQPLWTGLPWLTFLVTNGFKIIARKR
jgi:ubiquinone/menaquinone biosynthesis C-methylase UbiE